MSDEPDQNPPPPVIPPKEAGRIKRIWPWLLLQFLPAVVITIGSLLILGIHPRAKSSISPLLIFALVVLYWYVLAFFFFRSRGKSVLFSLLAAFATALVTLAANVVIIMGIVFVGCLVVVGKSLKM